MGRRAALFAADGLLITRLSTFSAAQILEFVSAGKIQQLFPFHPVRPGALPSDTVDDSKLVEASGLPLTREQLAALIQSNMPSSGRVEKSTTVSRATKKILFKSVVGLLHALRRAYGDRVSLHAHANLAGIRMQ
jgi:hypothetical protein